MITEKEEMTPEQMAKDLLYRLSNECRLFKNAAKIIALIVVNQILKECNNWSNSDLIDWERRRIIYWQQVKHEIEKL